MIKKIFNAIVVGISLIMVITYTHAFLTYYGPVSNNIQIISEDVNQPLIIWISFIGSLTLLFKSLHTILEPKQ
jgi:hypothetical protein